MRAWARDTTDRGRFVLVVAGLAVVLVAVATLSVTFGSVRLPAGLVWRIAAHESLGLGVADWGGNERAIVWQIRVPRVLLAMLAGSGLGVVGVAVQAMVRNSLADPFLLGVSSGASAGAVIALYVGVGVGAYGLASTSGFALLGGLAALLLVMALAQRRGSASPLRMILAGVAVSYALSGLTSMLILTRDDPQKNGAVLFWLLGSLAKATWPVLVLPLCAVAAAVVALLVWRGRLNVLLFGDETASSVGIDAARFRLHLLLLAAVVTAAICSVAGPIGFVGLLVPHVARMLVGTDHVRVVPVAVLLGATFLVTCDLAGRVLFAPNEIPVGAVTLVVGAPLLALLVARTDRFSGVGS